MVKTNLPVIILKGAVILPYCEFRLDLNNPIDKHILELSEKNHDSHLLIVSPSNPLEESIEIPDLPKLGVVVKVTMKMAIGKNIRIIVQGLNRVNVLSYEDYKNETNILSASITSTTQFAMSPMDETALIRKIQKRVEAYINKVPNASNSILSEISNVNSISKVSDITANYLPIDFERRLEYLNTINPYKRVIMLFEDIKTEEEIMELDKKIDVKLKKVLDDSQKEFILREKIKLIREELGDVNSKENDALMLKEKVDKLDCKDSIKNKIYNEIKKYELMNSNSPEVGVVRNYIDLMLSLPWNNKDKENDDLKVAREILDRTHYGLKKIKDRIIEYLAVKKLSNNETSPIICLVGPPGVGKTTLAKSIAEATNRKFVKISVGGVSDEAMIMGHRRTYIGSNPGKIITAIKKAKVNNPVFLIDEVDKMTRDLKGDPASALLEVLDKEQNKTFVDSYVEEEFDLSNVMFILTANYIENIPIELRDRLEIIELSSYTDFEKLDIAKDYLIKKNLEECGLTNTSISFSDNSLLSIIRNYTREAGVRELDRTIASILRKIATNIVEGSSKKKYIINEKNITNYLGAYKYNDNLVLENSIGTFNALAFTSFGGETLKVEVTYYKGDGKIILTGQLGDVMRESCEIALSYIKANCNSFGIDYEELSNSNIHIHALDGAVKKDGPSAGIAITTAIISAFKKKKVANNIGATGEISLNGNILPIGGLKEKSIGAKKGNIDTIIIPAANKKDLEEIEDEIKNGINYIEVSNYMDAYKILFGND
ncbi:MAG: endopeptidase La [Tenericutes bacterium]|nr:endopeptidase La [Mycoplasmatota bacterium]MDD7630632.1 endopeptidase La [bacterium]MDY4109241.1 endopeptidase La [Bacilli bacterium]